MSIIGRPTGYFNLHESNSHVGSFFSRKDLSEILGIDDEKLNFLNFDDNCYIDEHTIQKSWYDNCFDGCINRVGSSKISFDEIVLKKIIGLTYKDSIIETQVSFGRKKVDFLVTVNRIKKAIEYFGPTHFIATKYSSDVKSPFDRKNEVEDYFGCECIIWPFWIQKCTNNVITIFDRSVVGYGAFWNSNILYSNFESVITEEIIIKLNEQFNCYRNGYGYFFDENGYERIKPRHPILNKIKSGKENMGKILPNGCKNSELWIPDYLK